VGEVGGFEGGEEGLEVDVQEGAGVFGVAEGVEGAGDLDTGHSVVVAEARLAEAQRWGVHVCFLVLWDGQ
jgi:hypothetical protein